jgi:hypothetical protein
MERPKKISGEQGDYILYLEGVLSRYESKTTGVRSYFALKTVVDDLNKLMIDGIELKDEKTGDITIVPVISTESLSNKDDKILDRLFKFIGEMIDYNAQLKKLELDFAPELKKIEEEFGGDLEQALQISSKNDR